MWYQSPFDENADIPDEWVLERLRVRRNALLAASDWTQVADAPVDQTAWAEYRQALRDLPKSAKDPRKVKWPERPK
jgi:hypothetical protein